jgi:hypothetical protein
VTVKLFSKQEPFSSVDQCHEACGLPSSSDCITFAVTCMTSGTRFGWLLTHGHVIRDRPPAFFTFRFAGFSLA